MKIRVLAIIISFALLIIIISPVALAVDSPPISPGTIITVGNYSLYSFENNEYRFNIFLDTSSGVGSFAIIYSNSPNSLHEYSFTLPREQINVNSTQFWNSIVSVAMDKQYEWHSLDPQTAVSTNVATLSRSISYDYQSKYESLLAEEYGPEREYNYRKTYVVGGIIFEQREDISYGVSKSNTYLINNTMTVAGVITSIIGVVASQGLLTIIGLVATVGGVVTAGTRLDEYELYTYWNKYVVRQSGTNKFSSAQLHAYYYGYGSNKVPVSNELSLNLLDSGFIYVPTESFFLDDYAQFNDAYINYSS
jgi:hypothetical protein